MKILPINKNRIIIKQAGVDKITGKWKNAVDSVVELYKDIFKDKLVSVYISGSVATGDATENKSDIDTNAIVDMTDEDIKEIKETILADKIKLLNESISFVTKIEIHIHSKHNFSERKRFQMKITGVCVYGKNYDEETPDYKLSRETFQKFRVNVSEDVAKGKMKLINAKNLSDIKVFTTWIAKRLIRNAGTLVMWRGEFYTMDVSVMAEIFIKDYPNKKEEMKKLLNWVTNPSEDKDVVLDFLDTFGDWLIREDSRVFED